MIPPRFARTPLACIACLVVANPVLAEPPEIKSVSLHGLQVGGTTKLVIEGSGLLPPPRLIAEFDIREQRVSENASDQRVEYNVALDGSVSPGVYSLRAANAHGVSHAMVVGVDRLPQLEFVDEIAALPTALSGHLTGEDVLRTRFHGAAGQHIAVDVEARRLNSRLSPAIHLLDADGVQIAWSQMDQAISGDARLHARLPADGNYTIELHDALFRGQRPGHFRLKVGELEFADSVFPIATGRRGQGEVAVLDGGVVKSVEVVALDTAARAAPVPLGPKWATGGRPAILVSDLPELLEAQVAGQIAWPVSINGRLAAPGERDRYRIAVQPGQKLRIGLLAAKANSPLDGVLVVSDPQEKELARADDSADSTDPALDFDAPQGVEEAVVEVGDLLGRGGDEFAYRLSIDMAGRPEYRLALDDDRVQIPRDGVAIMRVGVERSGYDGAIRLDLPNLPAGVRIDGGEIPAGAAAALVTLSAGSLEPSAVLTQVEGRANATDARVRPLRVASVAATSAAEHQPWLDEELAVAVTEAAPLAVEWTPLAADTALLPRGAAMPLAATIRRGAEAVGPVKLSLLTTQVVPQKEVDGKQVDDVDRALRLVADVTIAADRNDAAFELAVPGDIAPTPFDLALRAELLAADGKETGLVAYSAARRLSPASPIAVHLVEPSVRVEAGGPPAAIRGLVERRGQIGDALRLSIEGLPSDLQPPVVELPTGQSEFTLPIEAPIHYPAGAFKRLTLVVRGATDAVRAESPLAIEIAPGPPPPALLRVFEDQNVFANRLTAGEGRVAIETVDRLAGESALRVVNGPRSRRDLPGLGVLVREQPSEGEYRYLRFAWKCSGDVAGAALDLFARRGAADGAQSTLRYAAGALESPADVANIAVAPAPPDRWVVVTRDLFADFGECRLDGLGLMPAAGGDILLDHVYLARSADDLAGCPTPLTVELPLVVLADDPGTNDPAAVALDGDSVYSGAASVRVANGGRVVPAANLNVRIRRDPAPGEHRYLQFAWRKQGGERIAIELGHDGRFGPDAQGAAAFRYDAGPAKEPALGAALRVSDTLPKDWVVVTRDLYADFGEFTLTGAALNGLDGESAWIDHVSLGRSPRDFELTPPRKSGGE